MENRSFTRFTKSSVFNSKSVTQVSRKRATELEPIDPAVLAEKKLINSSLLNYKPKASISTSVKVQNFQIAATFNTVHNKRAKNDALSLKK